MIPKAIKKCPEVDFNVCQYVPFMEVMTEKEENTEKQEWVWNGKSILITDEVGVGKTFETGIILRELYKKGMKIVIFCPAKLCSGWVEKLSALGFGFINYRDKKILNARLTVFPYSALSGKKKLGDKHEDKNDLNSDIKKETDLLSSNQLTDNEDSFLDSIEYDILVLDEAHYIRNKNTDICIKIRRLIEKNERNYKKLKIFLTGTPIFNSGSDNETLTTLLSRNPNSRSQTSEVLENTSTTGTTQGVANLYDIDMIIRTYWVEIGEKEKKIYKMINEGDYGQLRGFLQRIAVSSFATLKEWLNASDEKWKAMIEEHNANIDEELEKLEFSNNSFENEKKRLEEKKIDQNDKEEKLNDLKKAMNEGENKWQEEDDLKFSGLLELLNKLKSEEMKKKFKIVIFSTFISTCEYLKRRLLGSHYTVDMIVGETKNVDEIIGNFRKGDIEILICSEAVREGQDLQVSHYLIHYDLPYTPASIGQRNGRIYRTGQDNNSEIFYMRTYIPIEYEFGNTTFVWDISYDCRLFDEIIYLKYLEIKKANEIVDIKILPDENWKYVDGTIKTDEGIRDKRISEIKENIICEIIKKISEKSYDDNSERKQEKTENYYLEDLEIEDIAAQLCSQTVKETIKKFLNQIPKGDFEKIVCKIMKYYGVTEDDIKKSDKNQTENRKINEKLKCIINYLSENQEVDKMKVWEKNRDGHIEILKKFEKVILKKTEDKIFNISKLNTECDNSSIKDTIERERNAIREYEKQIEKEMKGEIDNGLEKKCL